MKAAVRLAVLLAAVLLSAASSRSSEGPPPAYGGGAAAGTGYFCHDESSEGAVASMCRPTREACESERQAAVGTGLQATECLQRSPVACFQLGGDPGGAAEWCAATLEDCDYWLRVDREKNGDTGQSCQWNH